MKNLMIKRFYFDDNILFNMSIKDLFQLSIPKVTHIINIYGIIDKLNENNNINISSIVELKENYEFNIEFITFIMKINPHKKITEALFYNKNNYLKVEESFTDFRPFPFIDNTPKYIKETLNTISENINEKRLLQTLSDFIYCEKLKQIKKVLDINNFHDRVYIIKEILVKEKLLNIINNKLGIV